MIINPSVLLGGDDLELWEITKKSIKSLICTLEKHINEYFSGALYINDFELTDMEFTINIHMDKEKVSEYIQLMHRIKETKKYIPKYDEADYSSGKIDKALSFDLVGKSNYTEFTVYDKAGMYDNRGKTERAEQAEGILRIEVRLKKRASVLAAVTICTGGYNRLREYHIQDEIRVLAMNSNKIFRIVFNDIVPRGDSYKLDEARSIIDNSNATRLQKEKMIRLINSIPEKRSLYKALIEMQDERTLRSQTDMLKIFAKIGLSLITISKRSKAKHLKSLYDYLPKLSFDNT